MEKEICVHHWIIEPIQGRYSIGQCKKCGEIREYDNRVDFYYRTRTFSKKANVGK